MLTEEALILLATIGASGLLVLGVVELVWPARPRHAATRQARIMVASTTLTRRLDAARELAPAAAVTTHEAPRAPGGVAEPRSLPESDVLSDDEGRRLTATDAAVGAIRPTVAAAPAPVEELPRDSAAAPIVPTAARPSRERRPHVLPVETCRTMYEEARFAEVVSLGSAALEVHAGLATMSHRPDEAAALLALVGLSKQALGDPAGACAAFRAALVTAAPQARPSYVRQLFAGAGVLAGADGDSGVGAAARVRELRACLGALDDASGGAALGDEEAHAARAALREALSVACERLAAGVGSGSEDAGARELVLEALADPEMPGPWREHLRDQLTAASSAEIGQLTAQAIRCVQEGRDADALEALDRAERLADPLPDGPVTEERREEVERRLWWGYSKVGLRRIENERFEGALEPLFRALRFAGADEDRAAETRGALVRALEGVIDGVTPRIAHAGADEARAARTELGKLDDLLRVSREHGVPVDELGELSARLMALQARVSPTAS